MTLISRSIPQTRGKRIPEAVGILRTAHRDKKQWECLDANGFWLNLILTKPILCCCDLFNLSLRFGISQTLFEQIVESKLIYRFFDITQGRAEIVEMFLFADIGTLTIKCAPGNLVKTTTNVQFK